jgi:hypothetical protein
MSHIEVFAEQKSKGNVVNWRTLGDAVRDCRLEGVAAELFGAFLL